MMLCFTTTQLKSEYADEAVTGSPDLYALSISEIDGFLIILAVRIVGRQEVTPYHTGIVDLDPTLPLPP